jgi:hypothetical protein
MMGLKGIRGVVTETSPFSDSKPYNLKRRYLLGLDLKVFPQLSATGKCARYALANVNLRGILAEWHAVSLSTCKCGEQKDSTSMGHSEN